jgi:hypothetical protein
MQSTSRPATTACSLRRVSLSRSGASSMNRPRPITRGARNWIERAQNRAVHASVPLVVEPRDPVDHLAEAVLGALRAVGRGLGRLLVDAGSRRILEIEKPYWSFRESRFKGGGPGLWDRRCKLESVSDFGQTGLDGRSHNLGSADGPHSKRSGHHLLSGPVAEAPPTGAAAARSGLGRRLLPGDPAARREDDPLQAGTVRDRRPSPFPRVPRGSFRNSPVG